MSTISTLIVSLKANSAKLVSGLKKGSSSISKFAKDARKKAKAVKEGFVGIADGIKSIIKTAAVGAGTVLAFFSGIAIKAGAIRQMSALSSAIGIGVAELQKWEFAAKSVGIESDKIGDIFKDTADKLGDFLVTGGGGAADLFEKLKISAADFIGLAPDKALLKFGEAMQPLTQKEKVFFLESLASDASLLLPLIDDNAAAFKRLAAEAEKAGQVLTNRQIEAAKKFSDSVQMLTGRVSGFWAQLTGELSAPLSVLTDELTNWIDSFGGVDGAAKKAAKTILDMIEYSIVGGATLINSIANIGTTFDEIKLSILEMRLEYNKLLNSVSPHSWLGKNMGLEFQPTVGELDQSRLEYQVSELEKKISINAANPTVKADFMSGATDLIGKMRDSLDKPMDDNTGAVNKSTNAVDRLTASLRNSDKKNEASTNSAWEKVFGKKDDPEKKDLKVSQIFSDYAKSLNAAINRQDKGSMAYFVEQTQRTIDGLAGRGPNGLNFGSDRSYDIDGMQGVLDKLVSKMNEVPEKVGSIDINVAADGKTMSGKLMGNPDFLKQLKQFVDNNTKETARAVAR